MYGQKIRVAQVITRLDWGGSPDIYRILSDQLNPDIYDITLIVGSSDHPTMKTKRFLARFCGRTIVVPSLKREISPAADIAAFAHLYSIFRRHKFDVVHTHTAKAGALGRLAAWFARVPAIVHTPHGHNFYGYFSPAASAAIVRAERFLTFFTDQIIALTELEKSDYIKFGVAGEDKITVIYQGLELDRHSLDWKEAFEVKSGFNIRPEDLVVGMVGRLEPVKGSALFIEAAYRIAARFPGAKFLIAGEGSLRQKMEERSRELGIADRVIFAGWREDIPAVLSAMDVMVLPSLNEAVGMALIEAQAQGVPVVASKVGGVPEIINDGKTGILVGPNDAEKIAEAVMGLLGDKKRCSEMGSAGKAWVHGRFMAEKMANKTSALYMDILNNKRHFVA